MVNYYPFWESVSLPLLTPNEGLPSELDTVILGNGYQALWTAFWLRKFNPKIKVSILNNDPYFGFSTAYRELGYSEMLFPITEAEIKELLNVLNNLIDKTGCFILSTSSQNEKALSNLYETIYSPYAIWLDKNELKKLFAYLKSKDGFFAPQYFTYDPIRILNILLRTNQTVPIYCSVKVKETKKHKIITETGQEIICQNIIHTSSQTNKYGRVVKPQRVDYVATQEFSKNLANILPNIPFKFPNLTLRHYQNRVLLSSRYTPGVDYRSINMTNTFNLVAEAVLNIPFLASMESNYVWSRPIELTDDFYPIIDYNDHEYFMMGLGDAELVSGYICGKIIASHLINNVAIPTKFGGDRF